MARLPSVGGDDDQWGIILNDYLEVSHAADGMLKEASIAKSKLDISTQTTLDTVASKYTKPASGIPTTDLSSTVQLSLAKADTALQSAPVTSVAAKTGDVTLAKADVGLANVDNTSDANKPVSTATSTALSAKSNKVETEIIVVYDDVNGWPARPTGYTRVRWVDGDTRPDDMAIGDVWEYDSFGSGGSSNLVISSTAPSNPTVGMVWIDTSGSGV